MNGGSTIIRKNRPKRRRILFVIAVLCVVIAVGYMIYRNNTYHLKATESEELYRLVSVKRGSITLKITSSGTINPRIIHQVTPKISSTVTDVFVKLGDAVEKGKLLISLDNQDALDRLQEAKDNLVIAEAKLEEAKAQANIAPTQAKLQVEQAKANLLNAEAKLAQLKEGAKPQDIDQAKIQVRQAQLNYENAKTEYERYKVLFREGAVTKQQLETTENKYLTAVESLKSTEQSLDLLMADPDPAEIAAAEAGVEQAKTSLLVAETNERSLNIQQQLLTAKAQLVQAKNTFNSAERNLDFCNVVSPISGTITEILAQPGQVAGQSDILAIVTDLKQLDVLANVDETDVHSIKIGQKARIMVESCPERTFEGVVESIAGQGKVISGVVYFEVTVKIIDSTGTLKSGMTADVDIIVSERSDVLIIPNMALESFNGVIMARVLDENKEPFFKQVKLGISDGMFTEVISGLEEGEFVAIRDSGRSITSTSGSTGGRTGNRMMQFMPGRAMSGITGPSRGGVPGQR